jgi:hypothetical protein
MNQRPTNQQAHTASKEGKKKQTDSVCKLRRETENWVLDGSKNMRKSDKKNKGDP